MILSTEAIVLHSRKYGDTSRIVVLYTRSNGKLSVHAKGARMPKSAFGSALDPLQQCLVTVYYKKHRELQTISHADVQVQRRNLMRSYDHLTTGLSLCEITLRTQADEEPNPELFDLLADALDALDTTPHPVGVGIVFRLRLAALMGFALPDSGPADDALSLYLSLENGLMTAAGSAAHRLSTAAYAALRRHIAATPTEAGTEPVQDADRVEIDALLSAYMSHHLERRIVTTSFDLLRPPS